MSQRRRVWRMLCKDLGMWPVFWFILGMGAYVALKLFQAYG